MVPLQAYLILSAIMFIIGAMGVVTRRNAIIVFLSIELMLNSVNLTLVAFSALLIRSETLNIFRDFNGNLELPKDTVITIDCIAIFVFFTLILIAIEELAESKRLEYKKL